MEHNVLGQWLGWLMAVIYMGGRLPQIYLNVRTNLIILQTQKKKKEEEKFISWQLFS